jgi:HEAT repeat protein
MRRLAEDNIELDFTALLKFALSDDDAVIREQAIDGLWECDHISLITMFLSALRSDDVPGVRAAAASALGRFVELAQDGKLIATAVKDLIQPLTEIIQDESDTILVRRRSLESLSTLSTPNIMQLIHSCYTHGDPHMKESAIYAMGKNGHRAWIPLLLTEVSNEDPAIRYEAASACGRLGDPSSIDSLRKLLTQEDDAEVQMAAIHALGAIGGAAAKSALLSAVDSEDDFIKDEIVNTLETLGSEESPLVEWEPEVIP